MVYSAQHEQSVEVNLKRRLFVTTVESVLLYGWEAWALTVKDKKALDGVYTRMLRAALNVTWEDHVTNVDLYGYLPRLSDIIRQKRMRLAGHCVRHPELTASEMIFWEPTHGKKSRGRPQTTYIDTLKRDSGLINPLRYEYAWWTGTSGGQQSVTLVLAGPSLTSK